MNVIGKTLGCNANNGILVNFDSILKSTLLKFDLFRKKFDTIINIKKFNEVLHLLYFGNENLENFLLERGYKVIKIFNNDNEINHFLESGGKICTNKGKLLLGNVYGDKSLKCEKIVIAIEFEKDIWKNLKIHYEIRDALLEINKQLLEIF